MALGLNQSNRVTANTWCSVPVPKGPAAQPHDQDHQHDPQSCLAHQPAQRALRPRPRFVLQSHPSETNSRGNREGENVFLAAALNRKE